jgi:EmrB/QacA subfamily drug resistance transporter
LINLPIRQKITIMLAAMSAMLLAALDQTIVSTALPRIVNELHGLNELSWVVTAYLLTSTISVPIAGKLSDIYGRKKMFLIGIFIFVVGSMLSGLSQNMSELILFRAIQGIGAGTLMSSVFSVVGDLFAPAERARWQGLLGAVFGLSSVIGPLVGGFLTDHASWRWNFYINVPVGILAFFMISTFMPHIESDDKNQSIDYLGAGLLTGGLSSLMLALVWGGNAYTWLSGQVLGMFALSFVLFIIFGIVEHKHAKDPILPLELFKNPIFRVSVIIVFLIGMAMFGAILYIPLFAQDVLGRSATNSGIILTPMILTLVVVSIVNGQIMSRTGKYKAIAVFGMAAITVAFLWLSKVGVHTTNEQLVVRMIIAGLGLGIGMPVFNLVVQNAFDHSKLGVATSSVQLARSIGSTVGVAIMGSIMNNSLAHHLSAVANDPNTQKIAAFSESQTNLSSLDANQLQAVVSPQAQHAFTSKIAELPASNQPDALASYAHFLNGVKSALASSISEVFLISGKIVSIAFFAALFLKEIPLRTAQDQKKHPLVSEGGAPGAGPS